MARVTGPPPRATSGVADLSLLAVVVVAAAAAAALSRLDTSSHDMTHTITQEQP